MKKLFVLTLLGLPFICSEAWGQKIPTSKIARAVAQNTPKFTMYTKAVHSTVLAAAKNTATLVGHKKARIYYGRPYAPFLRETMEEIKSPVLREMEKDGRPTFTMTRWKEKPVSAVLLDMRHLPFYLFNAQDGQKLFGSAFLIKDSEGMIATAVPTKRPIVTLGQDIKPFTFITIAMRPSYRLNHNLTMQEALAAEQDNPLPFHSIEVGGIENIQDFAFSPQDAASYALDPQSTLFEQFTTDGQTLYVPTQNMLFKDDKGRLFVLTRNADFMKYDTQKGGLFLQLPPGSSFDTYRSSYAAFKKRTLQETPTK
jgi:hypothetical protein